MTMMMMMMKKRTTTKKTPTTDYYLENCYFYFVDTSAPMLVESLVADIVSVAVVVDGDFGCGVDGDEYDYFADIGVVVVAAAGAVVAFCKTLQEEDLTN